MLSLALREVDNLDKKLLAYLCNLGVYLFKRGFLPGNRAFALPA
jgi:hypothetical protein